MAFHIDSTQQLENTRYLTRNNVCVNSFKLKRFSKQTGLKFRNEMRKFRIVFLNAKMSILECQKMALQAPQSKNGLNKPCETPPKIVG